MVYSANTIIYNEVINQNYNRLLTFAKLDEDRVHDSYLKVLNRITGTTFTASSMTELWRKLVVYTKTAIFNDFKTEMVLKKKTIPFNTGLAIPTSMINDDKVHHVFKSNYNYEAEDKLQQQELQDQLETQEQNQMRFEVQMLFEYLKKHYPESSQYVFRVYYLHDSKGKKITYKQLAEITGYSLSKCCGIIQGIKADLRKNLIPYINGS